MSLPKLKEFLSTCSASVEEVGFFLTFVDYVETEFQRLLYCDEHLDYLSLASTSRNFLWTNREQLAFDYV
jgi:hypothetical protein